MAKTINISFEGRDYTLEYTRKTVAAMENSGFNIAEVESKPLNTLPALFAGAFKAHHPMMKRSEIDAIYSQLRNKMELITKLAEMYNEPIASLIEEPAEEQGNVSWGASW